MCCEIIVVLVAESADPAGQALSAAVTVCGCPVSTVQAHGAPRGFGRAEQAMEARAEPGRFLHPQCSQGQRFPRILPWKESIGEKNKWTRMHACMDTYTHTHSCTHTCKHTCSCTHASTLTQTQHNTTPPPPQLSPPHPPHTHTCTGTGSKQNSSFTKRCLASLECGMLSAASATTPAMPLGDGGHDQVSGAQTG